MLRLNVFQIGLLCLVLALAQGEDDKPDYDVDSIVNAAMDVDYFNQELEGQSNQENVLDYDARLDLDNLEFPDWLSRNDEKDWVSELAAYIDEKEANLKDEPVNLDQLLGDTAEVAEQAVEETEQAAQQTVEETEQAVNQAVQESEAAIETAESEQNEAVAELDLENHEVDPKFSFPIYGDVVALPGELGSQEDTEDYSQYLWNALNANNKDGPNDETYIELKDLVILIPQVDRHLIKVLNSNSIDFSIVQVVKDYDYEDGYYPGTAPEVDSNLVEDIVVDPKVEGGQVLNNGEIDYFSDAVYEDEQLDAKDALYMETVISWDNQDQDNEQLDGESESWLLSSDKEVYFEKLGTRIKFLEILFYIGIIGSVVFLIYGLTALLYHLVRIRRSVSNDEERAAGYSRMRPQTAVLTNTFSRLPPRMTIIKSGAATTPYKTLEEEEE